MLKQKMEPEMEVMDSNSGALPKRKLDNAQCTQPSTISIDTHLKMQKRDSLSSQELKRCYSDGKISQALGEVNVNGVVRSVGRFNRFSPSLQAFGKYLSPRSGVSSRVSPLELNCRLKPEEKLKNNAQESYFCKSAGISGYPAESLHARDSPLKSLANPQPFAQINHKKRVSIDATGSGVSNAIQGRNNTDAKRSWPASRRLRNPGNLSLNLSQVDKDPDFTECDKPHRRSDQSSVCSRVTEFLFIGGSTVANNHELLTHHGITHIINCAACVTPAYFPHSFVYYNIRLRDHSSQDMVQHFYSIFDFIECARAQGGKILIHCVKGISRSPTIAIAYIMWYKGIGVYEALDFVRQARPVVDPNAGFIFQLSEWEQLHMEGRIQIHQPLVYRIEVARTESPQDDAAFYHSKCMNQHDLSMGSSGMSNNVVADAFADITARRPLIVGPLTTVTEDLFHSPTKEDSKASFVVSSSDCMYIWCGSKADADQVDAAKKAKALLQRFESFPKRCDIVYHGQEDPSFWHLVESLSTTA